SLRRERHAGGEAPLDGPRLALGLAGASVAAGQGRDDGRGGGRRLIAGAQCRDSGATLHHDLVLALLEQHKDADEAEYHSAATLVRGGKETPHLGEQTSRSTRARARVGIRETLDMRARSLERGRGCGSSPWRSPPPAMFPPGCARPCVRRRCSGATEGPPRP